MQSFVVAGLDLAGTPYELWELDNPNGDSYFEAGVLPPNLSVLGSVPHWHSISDFARLELIIPYGFRNSDQVPVPGAIGFILIGLAGLNRASRRRKFRQIGEGEAG